MGSIGNMINFQLDLNVTALLNIRVWSIQIAGSTWTVTGPQASIYLSSQQQLHFSIKINQNG
jgi:hypothetical protein